MKPKHTLKQVAFLIVAIMGLAFYAQAIKPAPKSPPPAVASAFARDYPGAKILNWSAEKNNGILCYNVESMDGTTRRSFRSIARAISGACPKGEVKAVGKLPRDFFGG